ERRLIEQHDPFERGLLHQQFDMQWLSVTDANQLRVADFVPGGAKQSEGLARVIAHVLRIAANRIGIRLREQIGRYLVPHRLQDFELRAFGNPRRCKLGAFEVTGDTPVLSEKYLSI